jgi:hypothetical protein
MAEFFGELIWSDTALFLWKTLVTIQRQRFGSTVLV